MKLVNLTRSLVAALIILGASPIAAQAEHSERYAQIRGKVPVHLRTSPNGRIVGTIRPGQKLSVDPHHSRGGWLRVDYHGKPAYVFNSYVYTSADRPHEQEDVGTATVDAKESAPLHAGANSHSRILDQIPEDTVINITGRAKGAWVPVRWDGKRGYLNKSVLSGDVHTEAAYCANCAEAQAQAQAQPTSDIQKLGNFAGNILESAKNVVTTAGEKISSWFQNAWTSAVKPRHRANFLGGGMASGNRSKGMCAQAAKEALVKSGICQGSLAGNAIDLHRKGIIKAHCPKLKLSNLRDPRQAPSGALIVYSGYAGRRRHSFGHVEAKIVKNGHSNYCSDFCRARPTLTSHNPVEAIYILE